MDTASYDNYYLPENLKQEINQWSVQNVAFFDARFNNEKGQTKSKKRNK